VRNVDQAKDCAAYLQQGIPRVIITLGDKGALLAGREGMEVVPAFPVATKDSTGAGDAFLGEGLPERDALRRANLYAAISTMSIGTQKSFVNRSRFNKEWKARA